MQIDADKLVENCLRDAFLQGLKSRFESNYGNNPLTKMIEESITKASPQLRELLESGIASCLNDAEFREHVQTAIRHSLAKLLVARFGGELEKQVNVLKSDPTTRARITLAIEEIVKNKTA